VLVAPPKKKDEGNSIAIPRVPHNFDLCHVTKPLKDVQYVDAGQEQLKQR
jgi:hypothetical protein